MVGGAGGWGDEGERVEMAVIRYCCLLLSFGNRRSLLLKKQLS